MPLLLIHMCVVCGALLQLKELNGELLVHTDPDHTPYATMQARQSRARACRQARFIELLAFLFCYC